MKTKKLLALLLAASTALSLTACGGTTESSKSKSDSTKTESSTSDKSDSSDSADSSDSSEKSEPSTEEKMKEVQAEIAKIDPSTLADSPVSDEADFTIDDSGRVTNYTGSDHIIVIPDTINGTKVTAIGHDYGGNFMGKGTLAERIIPYAIVIPEGVTTIEGGAIANLPNLTYISFPSTLTTIGMGGIDETNIAQVTLPVACTDVFESGLPYGASMQYFDGGYTAIDFAEGYPDDVKQQIQTGL